MHDQLLSEHIEREEKKFDSIDDRLSKLENQLSELIDLWTQAKGVLNFIKVVAGIGAACAAFYSFTHDYFTITPR